MTDNVPYSEEVTRGELRHALRGYTALGYPPTSYTPLPSGGFMIIIMAPPQTNIPDWRSGAFRPPAAPHGWNMPRFDWRRWARLAAVLMIVGSVGYLAYTAFGPREMLAGVPVEVGGMRLDPATGHMAQPTAYEQAQEVWDGAIDALRSLRPSPAPPAQEEERGWSWLPKNPVGDAIDGVAQTVQWLTYAVVVLAILWLAAFVAGLIHKMRD